MLPGCRRAFVSHNLRLALTLEQLVDDDARNPRNSQTCKSEEADKEEFQSEKHVTIIFRAQSQTGNAAFHKEEYVI